MNQDEKQNNQSPKKPYLEEETWANFPRVWKIDYMTGKISFNELVVLIFLNWEANPHNGCITTSYDKIAAYFPKHYFKDKTNGVNKMMLKLKKKRYIYYPEHKGSRTGFKVEIGGYLLSNKATKDISKCFDGNNGEVKAEGGISEAEVEREIGRSSADQEDSGQRPGDQSYEATQGDSYDKENIPSRTTNNDNDIDNNKNSDKEPSTTIKKEFSSINSQKFSEENPSPEVAEYLPKSSEEERCRDIAIWLGEKDMNFTLSKFRKNGLNKILEAYEITEAAVLNKGSQINRGAYFNSILKGLEEN